MKNSNQVKQLIFELNMSGCNKHVVNVLHVKKHQQQSVCSQTATEGRAEETKFTTLAATEDISEIYVIFSFPARMWFAHDKFLIWLCYCHSLISVQLFMHQ